MADNDNVHPDVQFSLDYLRTGGLVEMSVFADEMMKRGFEKVQLSSCDAVALCMLAAEAIDKPTEPHREALMLDPHLTLVEPVPKDQIQPQGEAS